MEFARLAKMVKPSIAPILNTPKINSSSSFKSLSHLEQVFGRLAKSKHTNQEGIIARLLRHNDNDTIYHYVEESTGTMRALTSVYKNL